MQDLHADARALRLHRLSDQPMTRNLATASQFSSKGLDPTRPIRRDAPGDNEANAAARSGRKIFCECRIISGPILKPGMHRAHDDAIPDAFAGELER